MNQILIIIQVFKATSANPSLLPVPQYIDVFVAVAQLVMDKDVGVANKAIMVTSNLPNDAYPKILDEMKITLEYDSSSKCNAFEVGICNALDPIDIYDNLEHSS